RIELFIPAEDSEGRREQAADTVQPWALRCHSHPYAERAGIAPGAPIQSLAKYARSGLGLTFLALFFRFELRELLLGQDLLRFLLVFCLARRSAADLVMVGHRGVHLCLLLRGQIEAGERSV